MNRPNKICLVLCTTFIINCNGFLLLPDGDQTYATSLVAKRGLFTSASFGTWSQPHKRIKDDCSSSRKRYRCYLHIENITVDIFLCKQIILFFYHSNLFIQIQSLNAKRWFSGLNAI